jgi:tetratricopeptide (TPR) repeat protein
LDGQAKFTEAQIHHHRALDIATRKGQSSTAEAAFVKTNMAHGLVEIGTKESLDKARVLQQGALEVYQSDPASDRRETATAHTNLARIAIKLREWDLAEENGRLALELLTRTKGATDAALIVCRSVLGVVLDYRFQEEKVVAFRDEAIALHLSAFQSATELFGTNHQATASTLVHLAEHHSIQGDYFEAEEAFRKAEKSLNETLGELHPKSIRALINRGTNQFFASNTNDAIQIYEVALTHAVQSMGPEHYLVGWVRFKIGTCLLKNGSHDLNDAIGHLQKAESVLAQSFPEDYFLRESCREKLHEAQVLLHN